MKIRYGIITLMIAVHEIDVDGYSFSRHSDLFTPDKCSFLDVGFNKAFHQRIIDIVVGRSNVETNLEYLLKSYLEEKEFYLERSCLWYL